MKSLEHQIGVLHIDQVRVVMIRYKSIERLTGGNVRIVIRDKETGRRINIERDPRKNVLESVIVQYRSPE